MSLCEYSLCPCMPLVNLHLHFWVEKKKMMEWSSISNSAGLRIPQKGNLILRPSQTGQIDSKLVSHDGLLKKKGTACVYSRLLVHRGMDKVPLWSVVGDRSQVSGPRGNLKCHLQSYGVVTHREGRATNDSREKICYCTRSSMLE